MGWEHEAETVWRAQELYCVDRLSFDAVARETGVAASTLKRWSEKHDWRAMREKIAQAEAEMRGDKVLARSALIKKLIENKDPQTSFAVAALETMALKEAEFARQGALRAAAAETPAMPINTPTEAVAALRRAVEQKLGLLLARPENVDLKAVQEVQKCLVLVGQLEAAQAAATPDGAGSAEGGLPADFAEQVRRALSGGA